MASVVRGIGIGMRRDDATLTFLDHFAYEHLGETSDDLGDGQGYLLSRGLLYHLTSGGMSAI